MLTPKNSKKNASFYLRSNKPTSGIKKAEATRHKSLTKLPNGNGL
ncbi:MAG: hypothetical protein JWR61_4710 [Ferruginibacter sp.]|nr:hypothetical protein [Ferruginibacter sp.]